MKHLVFVYGTLLKNERNHYLLETSKYIDEGYIDGYYMYNLGTYPGISKGKGKVYGQIYEVDDETLSSLDYLEAVGYLYDKIKVNVICNENIYQAYAYEYILEKIENKLNKEKYYWKEIK